jgi:hypothetical protein
VVGLIIGRDLMNVSDSPDGAQKTSIFVHKKEKIVMNKIVVATVLSVVLGAFPILAQEKKPSP